MFKVIIKDKYLDVINVFRDVTEIKAYNRTLELTLLNGTIRQITFLRGKCNEYEISFDMER